MVRRVSGPTTASARADRLGQRADGVPFLVEELLAVAVASGALVDSGDVVDAVARRRPRRAADLRRQRAATARGLGDEARTVLAAAAILGRRFDWDLLPRSRGSTSGRSWPRSSRGRHADRRGRIRTRSAFATPCLADAVLAELLPPERARLAGARWTPSSRRIRACPATGVSWPPRSPKAPATAVGPLRCCSRPGDVRWMRRARDGRDDVGAGAVLAPLTARRHRRGVPGRGAGPGRQARPGRRGGGVAPGPARGRAALRRRRAEDAPAPGPCRGGGDPLGRGRRASSEAPESRRPTAPTTGCGPASTWWPPRWPWPARRAAWAGAGALERGRAARPPGGGVRGAGDHRAVRTAARPRRGRGRVHAPTRSPMGTVSPCGACEPCTSSGPSTCCGGAWTVSSRPVSWLCAGALATVAVLDVQIAAGLAIGDDPEPSLAVARRATELARRYRLGAPLAAALGVRGGRPRPASADGPRWSGAWPRRVRARRRRFRGHRRVAGSCSRSWRRTEPPPAATSSAPPVASAQASGDQATGRPAPGPLLAVEGRRRAWSCLAGP